MTAPPVDLYLQKVEEAADPPPLDGLPRAIRALDAPKYQPPQWLIRDVWPMGLLGMLVGDGGTFKSSLALHIAGAVAGGYPVFDRYPAERRPVLVVSAEDDLDTMAMRLEAFVLGHSWDRNRVMGNLHLISTPEPVLGSSVWQQHVAIEVDRIGAGFVVFDPWADLLGGDENSNTDARPAIKYLRTLMQYGDCSVGVVHHLGKAGQEKRPLDRIRGASALPSAARVIYYLDWQDTVVRVENLKQSRAEKLPPFILERTIRSAVDNRAHWELARVTTQDAAAWKMSAAQAAIIEGIGENPGIGSREIRLATSLRNEEIAAGLKHLIANGYVSQTPGKQGKMHHNLTPSGQALRVSNQPAGPREAAATSDARPPVEAVPENPGTVGHTQNGQLSDRAHRAPSGSGHSLGARRDPHPLKGVMGNHVREACPEPSDDETAELDERLGIQEDHE